MHPHSVDRVRAARLLEAAGLDALVVAEPEGFLYITGVPQGVPGLFRRAGAGFAVLPADPSLPVGAVIGDLYADAARRVMPDAASHPLWMEQVDLSGTPGTRPIERRICEAWHRAGRPPGFARPATFDLDLAIAGLHGVLKTRGLAAAHLGFDFDFIAANDAARIRTTLPHAQIHDGSPALDRLRMVKTPGEIERLTLAVELAEAGLRALTQGAHEGQGAPDLHRLFRHGIEAEAGLRGVPAPPSWDYIAVGPDPWRPGGVIGRGSVIKADVGCVVEGYSSDTSRNYVFQTATDDQLRLHGFIEAAFDRGMAAIAPGRPLSDAHHAATQALHAAGLEGFSRGHLGHGLGHALFSEQWPFIAADTDLLFEPDMVMAFEVPLYVTGVGGFNLEDQIRITAHGHASMNTLPRGLAILGR